jgi:hypothetical protein
LVEARILVHLSDLPVLRCLGIDAQAASILLGNVKCFGTENRGGNFFNNQMVGTVVPIMQFANSDIEDLKIVDEEPPTESSSKQQPPSSSMPVVSSPPAPTPKQQPSIHDDPAIVSAVVSSTNKDLPSSNRILHDLQHLNLSDDRSTKLLKPEGERMVTFVHTGSGSLKSSFYSFRHLSSTRNRGILPLNAGHARLRHDRTRIILSKGTVQQGAEH